MKKWISLLLVLFTLAIFPDYGSAQMQKLTKKQKKELLKMAITDKVEKGQIKIDVTRIIPMGGTPKNTSNQYSLDLIDGKFGCYLPYFGSSSSAPIGTSDISFRTEKQEVDYEVTFNEKKHSYTIKFDFINESMHSKCKATIKISNSGICSIHVDGTHIGGMDYIGSLRL